MSTVQAHGTAAATGPGGDTQVVDREAPTRPQPPTRRLAGLDGLRTGADPGPRHDIDMYALGHTVADAPRLPLNLLDALRAFDSDATLKAMLGAAFAEAYLRLRTDDWNAYAAHFTEWERETTLDV